MQNLLLWICGFVFVLIGWASTGASADMKAKGDKSWKFSALVGLILTVLALLCWRAA